MIIYRHIYIYIYIHVQISLDKKIHEITSHHPFFTKAGHQATAGVAFYQACLPTWGAGVRLAGSLLCFCAFCFVLSQGVVRPGEQCLSLSEETGM